MDSSDTQSNFHIIIIIFPPTKGYPTGPLTIGRSGVVSCCNFLNPPFQAPVVNVYIAPFHR